MSYTLRIISVQLAQGHSSHGHHIPKTYVVANFDGTDEFYHTVTGTADLCQVFNGELQFEVQDPDTLLTLQLVDKRRIHHDRVLGLVHIHVSDLASLCHNNTVTKLSIHEHIEEGSKMHKDTITVLLVPNRSLPTETQSKFSSSNLPGVKLDRLKRITLHLTTNAHRREIMHLTESTRKTALQEYERQVVKQVSHPNYSAVLAALYGTLSSLDFIFKITRLALKINWVLECTWNVVSVLFKLARDNKNIRHKISEIVLRLRKTMFLVSQVDGLSESSRVDDAVIAVVSQVRDTSTFIQSYVKHGLIGRLYVQIFKDCEQRIQEHKEKLELVELELSSSLGIQNAQNIKHHLVCTKHDSDTEIPALNGTHAWME